MWQCDFHSNFSNNYFLDTVKVHVCDEKFIVPIILCIFKGINNRKITVWIRSYHLSSNNCISCRLVDGGYTICDKPIIDDDIVYRPRERRRIGSGRLNLSHDRDYRGGEGGRSGRFGEGPPPPRDLGTRETLREKARLSMERERGGTTGRGGYNRREGDSRGGDGRVSLCLTIL